MPTVKHLPISKSIANRLLILQAMQGKPLVLPCEDIHLCDDTLLLRSALQQIQSIQERATSNVQHPTCNIQRATSNVLNLMNCGTAMRFLTAYCAVQEGLDITLTGSERMHQRPIGQLVDALRSVRADIEYLGNEGYPPLRIRGKTLPRTPITLNDVDSSQFISALMLVGFPVSTNDPSPYIRMTQELIEHATSPDNANNDPLSIIHYPLERDWSAASYWYEYVALYGGEIFFPDLSLQTLQGDSIVAHIFESLGVHTEETTEGIRIYKDLNATQHPPVETPFMASPIDTTPSPHVETPYMASPSNTTPLPHVETPYMASSSDTTPPPHVETPYMASPSNTTPPPHVETPYMASPSDTTPPPHVETPYMASPSDTTPSLPLWGESEGAVLSIDFASCPDLYPAVYVTCHKLGITLNAQGTERLPHKESNRLQAFDQLNTLTANGKWRTAIMNTYSDHRIAMALLVAGYQVDDIDCISKSYPQFINQLRNITFITPCKHSDYEKLAALPSSPLYGGTEGGLVDDEKQGKKWALRKGIEQATTDYVWLTDADVTRTCYPIFVPPTLLGDLTILPLRMDLPNGERRTANGKFQTTEYLAIQSLTLWAAERGHAVMCAGANLIVNREHWLASYPDLHPEIPSGDDMFLLESFKRRKLSIKALYAPEYIATIQPEPTWKALFRQRMRWAGKAPKYRDKDILLCGILTFLANLLVLLCPPLVIFKYPFDLHFIRKAKQYNLTMPSSPLQGGIEGGSFLLSLFYPYYILICLIGGLIRQHKW